MMASALLRWERVKSRGVVAGHVPTVCIDLMVSRGRPRGARVAVAVTNELWRGEEL